MGAPLLQIEGLSVGYGDFQALWDISLSLNAAEVVAIIGANGAGKSTLTVSNEPRTCSSIASVP
jgi:ABC-type branched-subunit amino acid transport system ATPase component